MPFFFSFQGLLCQILEHLGYPSEPQLEHKRIFERYLLSKNGNNMTAYRVDQPERPQPATRRASHDIYLRRVMPFIGDPHSISEQPCSEMAAIRACQEQMLATQAQHTAILRQLQHHFDLPPAAEPSTSTTQCHTLIPQSLRPHLEQLLKRQTHLPSPSTTHSSD
ncbi:hypothetical protein CK203_106445 [Vitis vinifera]|uniref:Uncharacterized protein n=1 Tax=Vitis vinifera TaxID=29760 RepID=A0A438DGU0_VITVI|nr:hypothetical protein CK203_106445 [Vitis vinifera]